MLLVRLTSPLPRSARRSLSSSAPSKYIDEWFDRIQKPPEFYETWGNQDDAKQRRYFYNVDLQGRLFLEETSPKNIATSIKDEKFLDFFFSRIRPLNGKEMEFLTDHDMQDDYPFVSKCGLETNYIRPAATPFVFHAMNPVDGVLIYGGNLEETFDSRRLAISENTGRMYHEIWTRGKRRNDKDDNAAREYGLIRSSVAVSLSEKISEGPADKFLYDEVTEIEWLPEENEPGDWAMPDDGSMG